MMQWEGLEERGSRTTSNVGKNQGSIGIKDMKGMQQESDFELLVNFATKEF